jgi:predicted permease
MNSFFRKIFWLTQRGKREAELREEIAFHLEEDIEQRREAGLPVDDAKRAAKRELGNPTLVEEDTRAVWTWTLLEQFLRDLRYAFRLMRRSPGFTTVAAVSLALGIGANTAIFSLFDTIVLRRLPVAHPEQLVEFLQNEPGQPRSSSYWEWESYKLFRDYNDVFSDMTGMSFDNLASVHLDGSETETLIQENVLGNYFRVLGLTPAMGRLIGPEDVPAKGMGNVVVVSWDYWNSRLNRNPSLLGKRIFVGDQPKVIVGVAPRAYTGPRVGVQTDIWVPQEHRPFTILARLKPNVTIQQAQAEMAVLYRLVLNQRALREKGAHLREYTLQVEPAGSGLVHIRDQYGKPLVLLMGVVGLLLLLACINMASLLLARASGRLREIAVRVGLGASRGQLVGQTLTESMLFSFAGAITGVVFAYFGTGILVRIMASGRDFEHIELKVHPDYRVLLFTVGLALFTGLLFGIAPAWHAFRFAPAADLRQTGKGGETWFWNLFRKGLVMTQVALSILLVASAAIFLNYLAHLRNFGRGFRSDHVLLVSLDSTHSGYKPAQLSTLYQTLLHRLEAIPGVRSSSISGCTPLQGCGTPGRYIFAEGHVERPENRRYVGVTFVTPRYFETLGIQLLAGRDFSFQDVGRSRVVVVNQAMARRYFPNVNPIGKHITIDKNSKPGWFGNDQPYEIVGLVGDVKAVELRGPVYPTMYFDMFQENQIFDQFELRTAENPASLSNAVRLLMRDSLKTEPVTRVITLADQVDSNIVPERLIATLSRFFSVLGVTLAGVGLYGLLAYTVARRTNEVGIRIALGATTRNVSTLVLRDALTMVCGGVIAGVVLVLLSRPLFIGLMQDLKPDDTGALVVSGWIIIAVAMLAVYVPVRRAVRVHPMVALRHD